MKPFTPAQERFLLALATFGLLVPNGLFVYHVLVEPRAAFAALGNPVTLVLAGEALILMCLFAWLIRRSSLRSPGWLGFVVMSLLGSMAFSVPAFLFLASRTARRSAPAP